MARGQRNNDSLQAKYGADTTIRVCSLSKPDRQTDSSPTNCPRPWTASSVIFWGRRSALSVRDLEIEGSFCRGKTKFPESRRKIQLTRRRPRPPRILSDRYCGDKPGPTLAFGEFTEYARKFLESTVSDQMDVRMR